MKNISYRNKKLKKYKIKIFFQKINIIRDWIDLFIYS